jgi:hypothetical protein
MTAATGKNPVACRAHAGNPPPRTWRAMIVETPASLAAPTGPRTLVAGYIDPHGLYDTPRARDRIRFDPLGRCWLATGHEWSMGYWPPAGAYTLSTGGRT